MKRRKKFEKNFSIVKYSILFRKNIHYTWIKFRLNIEQFLISSEIFFIFLWKDEQKNTKYWKRRKNFLYYVLPLIYMKNKMDYFPTSYLKFEKMFDLIECRSISSQNEITWMHFTHRITIFCYLIIKHKRMTVRI